MKKCIVAVDTRDRDQLDQLLARVRARFGRVDMIVNPDLYSAVMPVSA